MINFASLFSQYRGSSNNAVNQMLQQNNVSLSKLIDQDSFINQFKAGNNKLIQFMKYDKIKQLIDYITVVGPEDDKKRSYKFPLTAADVLSCDLNVLQQFFFPSGKLFQDKITYQDVQVETQVELEQTKQTQQPQTQTIPQNLFKKQITIIKDTLQTSEQDAASKQKKNEDSSQASSESAQKPSQQSPSQQSAKNQQQKVQPTLKQKIKVKKIEQVQKIQKVQVPPLINHLFSYFDQEVNYILTGYVCKVLSSLFAKKGIQMMEFLFTQNRIQKMVNHIQSRSVGQFLLKVLTFQSNKFTKQRSEFFSKLLNKLSQNNCVHVLSNFSSFISQTIQKAAANVKSTSAIPQFTTIFFTPEVVTIVIKNVMSQFENVCVYNAPILLTYLTNVPFTLPQDQNIINQFKILLNMFIQKSLEKLSVTNKQRPKLGFGRIKIIQILLYILKENLLESRQIFSNKQNALPILFRLCKNYQMNNVLHNQVVKIISLSFTDKDLSQALLKNDVLLSFLLEEAEQDQKIRRKVGSQKFRKGYIGHIVQISRLVQQYASKNNDVSTKILERDEFEKVLTILVQKQISQGNKTLGGFALKKENKAEIMFQKQDIVTHYIDFLTRSPKPVFDPQPEPINIQHPDFLQQMERQIQQNLIIEQQSKSSNTQSNLNNGQKQSQTSNQPQVRIQVHFFKGHLDYDLDQLMNDL